MDDLIRRREVIAALGERPLVWVGSAYEIGVRNQYDCDRLAVETTPTVDAVPVVHGRWVESDTDDFVCSVCRNGYKNQPTIMGEPMFEYCPVCGAKMHGKGGDEHE